MNLKQKLLKIVANGLDKLQEKVNREYEEKGLTNKVLKAQLHINKARNKFNLTDPNEEKTYLDYVQ